MKDLGIESAYERMRQKFKERGKIRTTRQVKLNNTSCYLNSIYYVNATGDMMTVDGTGTPYSIVRTKTNLPTKVYVCAHCKRQYATHNLATEHYKLNEELTQ